MAIFDNIDFYPTPVGVIEEMISMLDVSIENTTVLEPHGGSGNIISVLKNYNCEVLSCEKDVKLQEITKDACDVFLGSDIIKVEREDISHIKAIIGNPPFSTVNDHFLKLWEIAPDGCRICLVLPDTIWNGYTGAKEQVRTIINTYGVRKQIGNAFSTAERKTDVECSLVMLVKPGEDPEKNYDDLFSMEESVIGDDAGGIMRHDEIQELVSRYVYACKSYDAFFETEKLLKNSLSNIKNSFKIGINYRDYRGNGREEEVVSKDQFKRLLQKDMWNIAFEKLQMDKYIVGSVKEDMNKFIQSQSQYPFSVRNIYQMCNIIFQTRFQVAEKVIGNMFDRLTKYTKENRLGFEGWKTNDWFMVNKKFIVNFYVGWVSDSYSSAVRDNETLIDLDKALCLMTNKNYDKTLTIKKALTVKYITDDNGKEIRQNGQYVIDETNPIPKTGEKFETEFFIVKYFKKGTVHMEFKNESTWVQFNKIGMKFMGWENAIPSDNEMKHASKHTKNKF